MAQERVVLNPRRYKRKPVVALSTYVDRRIDLALAAPSKYASGVITPAADCLDLATGFAAAWWDVFGVIVLGAGDNQRLGNEILVSKVKVRWHQQSAMGSLRQPEKYINQDYMVWAGFIKDLADDPFAFASHFELGPAGSQRLRSIRRLEARPRPSGITHIKRKLVSFPGAVPSGRPVHYVATAGTNTSAATWTSTGAIEDGGKVPVTGLIKDGLGVTNADMSKHITQKRTFVWNFPRGHKVVYTSTGDRRAGGQLAVSGAFSDETFPNANAGQYVMDYEVWYSDV